MHIIDDESDEETEELDSDPCLQTATVVTSDTGLPEEDLGQFPVAANTHITKKIYTETSQPLVVDTTLALPDMECVEAEENCCIQSFLSNTCGCTLRSGRPCSEQFTFDHYLEFRGQCEELTKVELDMVLLGQLSAFTFSGEQTQRSTTYGHPSAGRQHSYCNFTHKGMRVCRKTFLFLHAVSERRLKNLKASLLKSGLSPRVHGNTRTLPANTTSFADTQKVVHFLQTYAEGHAILLPGRIPGYKRSDLKLLPSSTTKRHVWLLYCESLSSTHHKVAYSTFCIMWRKFVPHIMVTKPMSDLCWLCQKNSVAIMRAANQPEEQKSEVKHTYKSQVLLGCTLAFPRNLLI